MNEVRFLNRKLNQAYEQAPWRRQLQAIGIFLLAVVIVALVAGINLNVTSRAATMGREIQEMTMGGYERLDLASTGSDSEFVTEEVIPIEELKIQIADLEAQLAMLTSSETMRERAERLGFQKVDSAAVEYVNVPGYQGRPEAMLAPSPEPVTAGTKAIPQAYRESLLDWLGEMLEESWLMRSPADLLLKGVNP